MKGTQNTLMRHTRNALNLSIDQIRYLTKPHKLLEDSFHLSCTVWGSYNSVTGILLRKVSNGEPQGRNCFWPA